jgi:hypothetical protein
MMPFHFIKRLTIKSGASIGPTIQCRNLSLGLVTKARACKGAGQEGSPGVTFHVPKSVRE